MSTGVPGSVGFETYMVWRINIVMWTCSTIEAVANLEGVSWMGEEFYKDVVERLKISAKIRLIHALKCKRRLSRDDPTVKGVQELFDIRNHYVHPKTHSMNDNDTRSTTFEKLIGYAPDTLWSLVQSVYAMTKDPPQEADQD
ncbi:MAG: hypothetical protein JW955_07035 [Sedimentisphaerales bacterium]|nr:hypothetical protein [Sedimentisphaerales bacterium]